MKNKKLSQSILIVMMTLFAQACALLGSSQPTNVSNIPPQYLAPMEVISATGTDRISLTDWGLRLSEIIEKKNVDLGKARNLNNKLVEQ